MNKFIVYKKCWNIVAGTTYERKEFKSESGLFEYLSLCKPELNNIEIFQVSEKRNIKCCIEIGEDKIEWVI